MGDEKDCTLWCGNLNGNITEELLYELFVQAGPLNSVRIPDGKNFAFVAFRHVESVPYAMELMKGVVLSGQSLRLQYRPGSIHTGGGQQQQQSQHQLPQQWIEQSNRGGYHQGGMGNRMGMPNQLYMTNPLMANQMMANQIQNQGYNALRPPMAGVLHNTEFHRSYYTSNTGTNNNNMSPLMGQREGQSSTVGRHGNRDNLNDHLQNNQHRRHDRSHSRDRDHSHDRHGSDRKRRHQDRSINPVDDKSVELDQQHIQKQASQNFRRGMATPPWKRSTAPWEQN